MIAWRGHAIVRVPGFLEDIVFWFGTICVISTQQFHVMVCRILRTVNIRTSQARLYCCSVGYDTEKQKKLPLVNNTISMVAVHTPRLKQTRGCQGMKGKIISKRTVYRQLDTSKSQCDIQHYSSPKSQPTGLFVSSNGTPYLDRFCDHGLQHIFREMSYYLLIV